MSAHHLCLLGDATSVHVRRWAREMLSRGYRVSLVTARPEAIDGVEQRELRPVARSIDWLARVGEARSHLAELAPDIVHAHYITSYGYLAARCNRHPLVMTAWGSDILVTPRRSRLVRWLTAWTLRQADLVTGDSLDLLRTIAGYRPRAALRQVHWGADMGRFEPLDWGAKTGFQIVSLRSWEPNYNVDTIVEAVALLRRCQPQAQVHLHLLGGGPDESRLCKLVQALGMADAVTLHGRVDDAAMVAVLQACKVSVSVPTSDATSVSMLESMACGLAVVASDLPANRQWLGDDAPMLVAPRDTGALAAALDMLCRDDAMALQRGQRNLALMQREGARAVQMDAMADLYAGLLDAPPDREAA
jgi:glycosyltransferase involved in cell wall biosynthesis